MNYQITLTSAENAALGYVALSQQEWIDNAVKERIRIATEEIVAITVQKCLDNNIQIPGSKDAMIELAFEKGWIKSAAQSHAEAIASTEQ